MWSTTWRTRGAAEGVSAVSSIRFVLTLIEAARCDGIRKSKGAAVAGRRRLVRTSTRRTIRILRSSVTTTRSWTETSTNRTSTTLKSQPVSLQKTSVRTTSRRMVCVGTCVVAGVQQSGCLPVVSNKKHGADRMFCAYSRRGALLQRQPHPKLLL